MIYAMACGDEKYIPSARFQLETAVANGKVDKTLLFNLNEMDKEFVKKNKAILEAGGTRRKMCYLWKPYFIQKALSGIADGDYLIYMDGGNFYYRNSVLDTIQFMEKHHLDVAGSRTGEYRESDWTKRDVFVALGLDREPYISQSQCRAGFLILKKTQRSTDLINEWLGYCQNYNLITDCPNIYGKENYEGFCEHRHDQSILSLLMGRDQIPYVEQFPLPYFVVYHHSFFLTIKEIQSAQRKKFRDGLWDSFKRHDLGMMLFIFQNRRKEWLWYQKYHQRKLHEKEWQQRQRAEG